MANIYASWLDVAIVRNLGRIFRVAKRNLWSVPANSADPEFWTSLQQPPTTISSISFLTSPLSEYQNIQRCRSGLASGISIKVSSTFDFSRSLGASRYLSDQTSQFTVVDENLSGRNFTYLVIGHAFLVPVQVNRIRFSRETLRERHFCTACMTYITTLTWVAAWFLPIG